MTDYVPPTMTPEQRDQYGAAWFTYTMTTPPPKPDSPYYANGIRNFVFGEMWCRPGLDMRARRFITLACVACAGEIVPIQTHFYAAMKSGDISFPEMQEFVLHYAVYYGWPKASIIERTVRDLWAQIEAEGGPVVLERPVAPTT